MIGLLQVSFHQHPDVGDNRCGFVQFLASSPIELEKGEVDSQESLRRARVPNRFGGMRDLPFFSR